MPDLYANYAQLAAAETIGVDYSIVAVRPRGASWASIAIHGGGIEPGTSEVAEALADARGMRFYEFDGLKLDGTNDELHITSANFDEPQCVDLVTTSHRVLSFHGYTGTTGVAETLMGGLDSGLRTRVMAALQAAGFTVSVASSEYPGTDPANICNRSRVGGGVQLEMSRALRESMFTDFTRDGRKNPANRTAAFDAYVAAVASVLLPDVAYDPQLSRLRLTGVAPGLLDTFSRTVTDGWGDTESGQAWLLSGSATAFQVNGGLGKHVHTAAAVSRWSLAAVRQADWDFVGSVGTDVLAAGGGQFHSLVGRSTDDGATCYLARVEFSATQQVILTLRKRVAGTETLLVQHTTSLTHTVGGRVAWQFQGVGSSLRAKAWSTAGGLPANWQLETTDTAITGTGRIGCRSILSTTYTGALPVTSSWDSITSIGEAVVERSVDGVRWTTVRGATGLTGAAGAAVSSDDYEFAADVANQYRVRVYEPESGSTLWVAQDSISPDLGGVWLKSLARPFLNRQVTVRDFGDVTRPSRSGIHDVVGRSDPVAVTDVRGSRQWQLLINTYNQEEADDLDLLLASGDILLVHVPAGAGRISAVPGGYVTVGDCREVTPPTVDLAMRVFELPCKQVAAPGPDVVGATSNWQTVLNTYATWADLLVAHASWASVLELVGDPTDVIVS